VKSSPVLKFNEGIVQEFAKSLAFYFAALHLFPFLWAATSNPSLFFAFICVFPFPNAFVQLVG
jgi:hypothetical protein